MQPIDFIILIPLVWGAYKGYTKGFLIEITTLVSLVLAIFLGFQLMDKVIIYLKEIIDVPDGFLPFIAFISVFVGVLFAVNWMSKGVKKFLDVTLLGQLDNLAGAIFGSLKFAFIISIILWLSDRTSFIIPSKYTEGAMIYPILIEYSPTIIEKVTSFTPFTKDLVYSINKLIAF